VAGNREPRDKHLKEARRLAETVTDEENKKLLLADLDSIV